MVKFIVGMEEMESQLTIKTQVVHLILHLIKRMMQQALIRLLFIGDVQMLTSTQATIRFSLDIREHLQQWLQFQVATLQVK